MGTSIKEGVYFNKGRSVYVLSNKLIFFSHLRAVCKNILENHSQISLFHNGFFYCLKLPEDLILFYAKNADSK